MAMYHCHGKAKSHEALPRTATVLDQIRYQLKSNILDEWFDGAVACGTVPSSDRFVILTSSPFYKSHVENPLEVQWQERENDHTRR